MLSLPFSGKFSSLFSGRSEKQRKADVKKAAEESPEKSAKKSAKEAKKLNKEKKKRADAVLAKYEGDAKFQVWYLLVGELRIIPCKPIRGLDI